MSQGIENLKKLADSINSLVDIGENVFKDGKLGLDDLSQLGPLSKEVMNLVAVFKEFKDLKAEASDIDAAEAIALLQALLKK